MNNNTQNNTHYSTLSRSLAEKQNKFLRIFLKVDQIVSAPNTLTVAYGYDLHTKEYIGIRLNTVDEYASDLMAENPSLKKDDAFAKAKQSYVGSHARESLNDKRDKRKARFLSFDRCFQIDTNPQGITLYRSHWSEMISSNQNCEVFEGMAYLHLREAVQNQQGVVIKKEVAHLNIIQQIKTLTLGDFAENMKVLRSALTTSFNNGMRRTGYAIFEIIDVKNNQLIAETFIFQKNITEVATNPNTGLEYNTSKPAEVEESISEYMNHQHTGEINHFMVERDFLRVLMPLFFDVKVNRNALCQQNKEYLKTLHDIHTLASKGEIKLRLTCIHQIYLGVERKNLMIKNINKGLVKAYSHKTMINNEPVSIRRYMPTLFALHFHTDTQNPYVAFNIIGNNPSNIPPTPLYAIPDDIFNIRYQKLV